MNEIMAEIYVIIVTWNGMKWIEKCLNSVESSDIPVNTVVVDNGSTDGTISFIKSRFPKVIIIESQKNLGFGQANNIGIKYALTHNADFVYLLNQDAYIFPNMFSHLLDAYSPQEKIGILSPLHLSGDGMKLDSQFAGYLSKIFPDILADSCLSSLHDKYYVSAVPAAGWFLPVNTLVQIGGFDPIFFHYGEDHNYAQRVKYHKLRIAVVPKAMMIHDRNGFGNEKMASKKMYFRTVKTEIFMDINLSYKEIAAKSFKIGIKYFVAALQCLLKGAFKQSFELICAVPSNLLQIRNYRHHRKIDKATGTTWL